MKVYDIWYSYWDDDDDEDLGWVTTYDDSLEGVMEYLERVVPGSDWIIVENELPF